MNTQKTRHNALGRIGGYIPRNLSLWRPLQRAAEALFASWRVSQTPISYRLANHGNPEMACLANATPFSVIQGNLVQITPYGDFQHTGPVDPKTGRAKYPNGVIQRVDAATGNDMVNQFNSLAAKIGRYFGGLPWYVGHHDVDPITYPDGKSYGWVEKLENKDDGVWAHVKWTPDGENLKTSGAFKYFSPYWDASLTDQVVNGKPVLTPSRLLSVAFTNNPNLPVMPLANELRIAPAQSDVEDELAQLLIANAICDERIEESTKTEWTEKFANNFIETKAALANAGTSAGNKKGWETRRRNAAAKAAAKTLKITLPKKSSAAEQSTEPSAEQKAASQAKLDRIKSSMEKSIAKPAATPPPLPKIGTPERAALYQRVAASTFKSSGGSHEALTTHYGAPEHSAFMQ